MAALQLRGLGAVQREGGDGVRMRDETARHEAGARLMDAEHGEGIAVGAGHDGRYVTVGSRPAGLPH